MVFSPFFFFAANLSRPNIPFPQRQARYRWQPESTVHPIERTLPIAPSTVHAICQPKNTSKDPLRPYHHPNASDTPGHAKRAQPQQGI